MHQLWNDVRIASNSACASPGMLLGAFIPLEITLVGSCPYKLERDTIFFLQNGLARMTASLQNEVRKENSTK